jgi:hypothetical protein
MKRRFFVAAVTMVGALTLACAGGCSDNQPRPKTAEGSKPPPGPAVIKQAGQEQKLAGNVPGT